jgi:hypothetical protein
MEKRVFFLWLLRDSTLFLLLGGGRLSTKDRINKMLVMCSKLKLNRGSIAVG